jgi:hypothetical protein
VGLEVAGHLKRMFVFVVNILAELAELTPQMETL